MAFVEQKISTGKFLFRFAKLLARPGAISTLRSILNSRPDDEISAADFLERHAKERPNDLALMYEDQTLTWQEFNAQVNQTAHYFQSRGIKYGDRIAINIENRPDLLVNVLACLKLGAVAGMVNTGLTNEALAHCLRLIEPSLLVIGSECVANMDTVADLIEEEYQGKMLFLADGNTSSAPKGYLDLAPLVADMSKINVTPDQTLTLATSCFLIFTSGTTGLPKASITSNLRLFRGGTQFGVNVMTLSPKDVYYCPLPLYHSTALIVGFASSLIAGSTFAIRRKFSATQFFDDCRKFNATAFVYIGELLRYLLALPASAGDQDHNVEKIIGNGLRPDIWMDFKNRFNIPRIHEFYGASEGNTAFVNIFNFDKTVGWSPGAGKAWTIVDFDVDADAPIRNQDGFMTRTKLGHTGLLIVAINEQNPFDGYTDPAASEKKILRNVFVQGDQYFNSGDLVVLQPHGHIQFGDRIGDTFRWQGENVATTEVESVIMQWPDIQDAVVYGVEVPGRDGRCGMLYATLKDQDKIDLDGLVAHMREKLPAYAVPRFIRIGAKADVTGTFKFQKAKLKREAYAVGTFEDKLYLLARDAEHVEPLTSAQQKSVDAGDIRL
jgi:acyl-CoA synthetase (AMP-forming)/AMP-acid ligase II